MPGERKPGMDHAHYPYRPLPARPALRWPNGEGLAFAPVIHLEHWELLPQPGTKRVAGAQGPWGSFAPDWRTFTYRDYGNRIGIWRVLEALEARGLRATIALGAAAAARHPELVAACVARGHDFAAHPSHATRIHASHMTEAEERAAIAAAIGAVQTATGTRPKGWIAQDFSESYRTPQLVAEAGLQWLADWPNDEQPYALNSSPRIVSVPVAVELDDAQMLWSKLIPSWEWPPLVAEAASRLTADAADGAGRCLLLGLHPWLVGQPHRIRYLEEALDSVLAAKPWCTTVDGIAEAAAPQLR
ncbi:polysaccharide deacetylase family protein [Falsiroseomonas sp. HW251]|uniref:polysaccharide deacetylase family protein n=1 Tax=Falsiroseomonas sp. HW251 TaxID=3390998 RepID=UPI003D320C61